MTKRIVSLLLVLMLAMSLLAGCGSEAPEDKKDNEVVSNNTPVATDAPTEPPMEDRPLALGEINGNTYTNTYAGIGVTFPEGWYLLPAEELQEMPSNVRDLMEGTELGDAIKDVQQFTDVFAENVDDLVNVNILFQKQTFQQRAAFMMLTEEQIADETMKQKDMLFESYAAAGINASSMEKVTVTFLGEEHIAIKTVAETQGVPYYILQVFNYHLGEYSVVVTMASFVEDNTESMLDMFYSVD